MAADEPAGIEGIILIQFTFQKEEPAMTGAVVRIAGDTPVTSARDSPFFHYYRSRLLFIEFLIANQSRQSSAHQVKTATVQPKKTRILNEFLNALLKSRNTGRVFLRIKRNLRYSVAAYHRKPRKRFPRPVTASA
jgi:hypothetical protein